MSDEGTSFTIDLPVTGQAQLDAAAASVGVLVANLDGASKASVAASAAVGGTEASYRQAEQSADRAAKALERITMAADAQRGKLKTAMDAGDAGGAELAAEKLQALTQRQAEAAAKAAEMKAALEREATALDQLGKKTDEVDKAEEGEGIKFEALERGLNKLGGPLGKAGASLAGLGSGFGKMSKALGDTGPEVAVVVVLVAITAAAFAAAIAVAAMTAKVVEWAVGMADANRNAALLSQGIARSVAGGNQLNDKINSLTKTLPLTREELSATAEKLANAGLRGTDLTNALERSATAAAKLKFGPDFGKEMLSLDQQSKVFHENLSEIFGGLKIDGLLEALQKLIGLFSANEAIGHALKVVFESIFQPIVDWLAKSEPKIEAFFLQLAIWAMKAMIAIKPHASIILKVGEAFLIVAGILVGVLAVAIALAFAPIALIVGTLVAVVLGVQWFVGQVTTLFEKVKSYLKGFSLADLGKAMIEGLANGITNGGAAILSAIKGAVTGAIDSAKKLLGIASPSKVFAEIGMQTGAGMAVGVDRSTGSVQGSLEGMVSPPSPGSSPAAGAAPAASSGAGKGASISGNTFILNGVEGAADAEARIAALLTRIMEGDAAQLGAVAPG